MNRVVCRLQPCRRTGDLRDAQLVDLTLERSCAGDGAAEAEFRIAVEDRPAEGLGVVAADHAAVAAKVPRVRGVVVGEGVVVPRAERGELPSVRQRPGRASVAEKHLQLLFASRNVTSVRVVAGARCGLAETSVRTFRA